MTDLYIVLTFDLITKGLSLTSEQEYASESRGKVTVEWIQPAKVYFTTLSVSGLHSIEYCYHWWMMNFKGLEGSRHGLIELISRNLPGDTEENHEKHQAE
jgi:hypothetical protein